MTAANDAWIYRDARVREPGVVVRARLLEAVLERRVVEAAVLAGEIEAALADVGHPAHAAVAAITDALAVQRDADPRALASRIERIELPETIAISVPEGFAYYALHPASYADAVARLERPALVVGVRSIGTTLSAFAAAALGARRITVRPFGPPFARRYAPSPHEIDELRREESARIVVVDEGPGLSGSTLLAVVDGIAAAGVPRSRISVVCSHAPDPSRLLAPDGAARWAALDVVVAAPRAPRGRDVSGGAWRALHFAGEWPAVFAQAERRKALDDGRLVKWEGLGSAAMRARARGAALARAGFSPEMRDDRDGWASTVWRGEPLGAPDVAWFARYCAARAELFPASDAQPLAPMVSKNLGFASPPLPIVRAVIADGRMHRHEWLRDGDRILKVDAIAHGDDHFFPGPTDIAWDLAGAIVEWSLPRAPFLEEYARLTGDDAAPRIDGWITAYAAFQRGVAHVAFDQAEGDERARLAARIEFLNRSIPPRDA